MRWEIHHVCSGATSVVQTHCAVLVCALSTCMPAGTVLLMAYLVLVGALAAWIPLAVEIALCMAVMLLKL